MESMFYILMGVGAVCFLSLLTDSKIKIALRKIENKLDNLQDEVEDLKTEVEELKTDIDELSPDDSDSSGAYEYVSEGRRFFVDPDHPAGGFSEPIEGYEKTE